MDKIDELIKVLSDNKKYMEATKKTANKLVGRISVMTKTLDRVVEIQDKIIKSQEQLKRRIDAIEYMMSGDDVEVFGGHDNPIRPELN